MQTRRVRPLTTRRLPPYPLLLGGVAINLLLVLQCLSHYPAVSAGEGVNTVAWVSGLLLLYGVAALVFWRLSHRFMLIAVQEGTEIGAVAGILWMIYLCLQLFANPPAALLPVFMAPVWLLFGVAGLRAYYRTGHLGLGVLGGMWSALCSALVLMAFAILLNFIFSAHLERLVQAEFARSGLPDATAYALWHTLNGAAARLLEGPLIAAGVSLAAIGLYRLLGRRVLAHRTS